MKTRLLLYTLAGFALVLAFILWPAESTPYSHDYTTDGDAELTAILEASERERKIIVLRYFRDMTQSEVAEKIGVSQVQVSRIESKIIKEFRKKLIG